MEGIFFYWFAWIGWAIVTFFMEKQSLRTFYAAGLLGCIMLSGVTFHIKTFTFNAAFICLLLLIFTFLSWQRQLFSKYLLFSSFIMMMAYAGFCLFELFDPVWIFIERKWAVGLLLFSVVCVLVRNVQERLICLMIGLCYGDFLFAFILNNLRLYYPIGTFPFLDIAAISCMLVLSWEWLSQFVHYLELYALKYGRSRGSKMRL